MKPYLVEEIRSFGKLVKRFEPTPVDKPIVSASTCGKLHAMMEGVVTRGTAKGEIKNINYKSGGKTGTAQIPDAKKGFSEGSSLRHLASFCGYFPADNPVYSCIIVVFDPKAEEGRYYGSQIACPVFRELADVIYASSTNLHTLQPNLRDSSRRTTKYPAIANGAGADLINASSLMNIPHMNVESDFWYVGMGANNGLSLKAKSNFGAARVVPELAGFSAKDAIYIVEHLGYQARVEGAGKVIRQTPTPGTPLPKGEIVHFVLGMPSTSNSIIDRPKKDSTKRK
jgi:cell division protein FtsI (penicillin-binding protein 3)